MAGSHEQGLRAAATNYQRYGLGFYRGIGRMGGKVHGPMTGFATNHARAVAAGRKGAFASHEARRRNRAARQNA